MGCCQHFKVLPHFMGSPSLSDLMLRMILSRSLIAEKKAKTDKIDAHSLAAYSPLITTSPVFPLSSNLSWSSYHLIIFPQNSI